MGRLIVSTQMTLDGVIEVGEWYVADGEHDRAGKDQLVDASAVLLGRKTYEGLAAYWSPLNDDWANLINPKPKYVASRTLHGPLEWSSTLLEGDAAGAVTRLKDELPSGPLGVRLWRAGPVPARGSARRRASLLGSSCGLGPRRAPLQGEAQSRLRLLGSEAFDSGVTLLRYAPI